MTENTSGSDTTKPNGSQPAEASEGHDDKAFNPSDILHFDPFAPMEQEERKGEKTSKAKADEDDDGADGGAEGQHAGEDKGGDATSGEKPPETPAAEQNPEVAALRQQISELTRRLNQRDLGPQEPQQPQQRQPEGGDDDTALLQRYMFQLPPQLLEAIRSDDPTQASQGIQMMLAGVGASIHRNLMQEVREQMTRYVPSQVQQITSVREQRRRVFEDFYENHKDLKKPEFYPVVFNVARQVATELGATAWTEQVRDETAKRVRALFGMPEPAPAGKQPPRRQEEPKTRQPAMTSAGGARAPASTPDDNSPSGIQDTLFGGR